MSSSARGPPSSSPACASPSTGAPSSRSPRSWRSPRTSPSSPRSVPSAAGTLRSTSVPCTTTSRTHAHRPPRTSAGQSPTKPAAGSTADRPWSAPEAEGDRDAAAAAHALDVGGRQHGRGAVAGDEPDDRGDDAPHRAPLGEDGPHRRGAGAAPVRDEVRAGPALPRGQPLLVDADQRVGNAGDGAHRATLTV